MITLSTVSPEGRRISIKELTRPVESKLPLEVLIEQLFTDKVWQTLCDEVERSQAADDFETAMPTAGKLAALFPNRVAEIPLTSVGVRREFENRMYVMEKEVRRNSQVLGMFGWARPFAADEIDNFVKTRSFIADEELTKLKQGGHIPMRVESHLENICMWLGEVPNLDELVVLKHKATKDNEKLCNSAWLYQEGDQLWNIIYLLGTRLLLGESYTKPVFNQQDSSKLITILTEVKAQEVGSQLVDDAFNAMLMLADIVSVDRYGVHLSGLEHSSHTTNPDSVQPLPLRKNLV